MTTREGRPIYPDNAPIRESIRANSQALCGDCKHLADLCAGCNVKRVNFRGYTPVVECDGFEPVEG